MLVPGRAQWQPAGRIGFLPSDRASQQLYRSAVQPAPAARLHRHNRPYAKRTHPGSRVACSVNETNSKPPDPIRSLLQACGRLQGQAQATLSELPIHNSKFLSLLGLCAPNTQLVTLHCHLYGRLSTMVAGSSCSPSSTPSWTGRSAVSKGSSNQAQCPAGVDFALLAAWATRWSSQPQEVELQCSRS